MQQKEAFSQPLEPEPGYISGLPDAAEIARRDAEYLAPAEPEDPDGIVGTGPPEHGWPGKAFVGIAGAGGVLAIVRILYLLVVDLGGLSLWQTLGTLPMMLLPGAVMLWMAWKIHNFRLVGIGLAFVFLLLSLYAAISRLLAAQHVTDIVLGFLVAGLSILWMGYLWMRRTDFS